MAQDRFSERFEQVRERFVTKLDGRIKELDAALPSLTGGNHTAFEAVTQAHRRIHDLCGLSPTVGFPAIGRAARGVEEVLRVPLKAERGLTEDEFKVLRERLEDLRATASAEIQPHNPGE